MGGGVLCAVMAGLVLVRVQMFIDDLTKIAYTMKIENSKTQYDVSVQNAMFVCLTSSGMCLDGNKHMAPLSA